MNCGRAGVLRLGVRKVAAQPAHVARAPRAGTAHGLPPYCGHACWVDLAHADGRVHMSQEELIKVSCGVPFDLEVDATDLYSNRCPVTCPWFATSVIQGL